MNDVIIYQEENNQAILVWPSLSCGISIYEIARKDVPIGKPFKIIDSSILPKDHIFYDALEADFSNPDGYGVGSDAWFLEQKQGV